jgi:hypothetical protein
MVCCFFAGSAMKTQHSKHPGECLKMNNMKARIESFVALLNIVRLYVCSIKVVVVFFGYTLARLLTLFRQKIMQRPGETG